MAPVTINCIRNVPADCAATAAQAPPMSRSHFIVEAGVGRLKVNLPDCFVLRLSESQGLTAWERQVRPASAFSSGG